ncbi:MAG: hypothetical protein ACYC6C_05580 [Coriobacteriia bacterium]
MAKTIIKTNVTKEVIEAWKKKFGAVYKYSTKDGKVCYLKCPDLQILDACRTISGGSSLKFDQALVDNCWLEGDLEFKTVDKYRMGLYDWLGGIVKKIDGQLEEL